MRKILTVAISMLAAMTISANATSIIVGPTTGGASSPPTVLFGAGDNVLFIEGFETGEGLIEMSFEATEAVKLVNLGISLLGGSLADLAKIDISLSTGAPVVAPSASISPDGTAAFGGGFFENFVMNAGEVVTLSWDETASLDETVSISFRFAALAAIPVPAALPLLLGGLGGLAMLKRRKKAIA